MGKPHKEKKSFQKKISKLREYEDTKQMGKKKIEFGIKMYNGKEQSNKSISEKTL